MIAFSPQNYVGLYKHFLRNILHFQRSPEFIWGWGNRSGKCDWNRWENRARTRWHEFHWTVIFVRNNHGNILLTFQKFYIYTNRTALNAKNAMPYANMMAHTCFIYVICMRIIWLLEMPAHQSACSPYMVTWIWRKLFETMESHSENFKGAFCILSFRESGKLRCTFFSCYTYKHKHRAHT